MPSIQNRCDDDLTCYEDNTVIVVVTIHVVFLFIEIATITILVW